jgi:predicted ATPase
LRRSVRVWQVLAQNRSLDRFDALHGTDLTPLEGRDEENELIRQLWQEAKSGQGRVVLISGEAGIGKSRLTRVLRDSLINDSERYTELSYYCSPYFQNSALHPVISQLERTAKLQRDPLCQPTHWTLIE